MNSDLPCALAAVAGLALYSGGLAWAATDFAPAFPIAAGVVLWAFAIALGVSERHR